MVGPSTRRGWCRSGHRRGVFHARLNQFAGGEVYLIVSRPRLDELPSMASPDRPPLCAYRDARVRLAKPNQRPGQVAQSEPAERLKLVQPRPPRTDERPQDCIRRHKPDVRWNPYSNPCQAGFRVRPASIRQSRARRHVARERQIIAGRREQHVGGHRHVGTRQYSICHIVSVKIIAGASPPIGRVTLSIHTI